MRVRHFMTEKVFSVCWTQDQIDTEDLLTWPVTRHVPVTDEAGRLLGMLDERDLLRESLASRGSGISLEKVLMVGGQMIEPDAPIQEAARILLDGKTDCLPVVADGRLVGILTGHDLLHLVEDSLAEHAELETGELVG
ncbi:MAG: CBS domain-containing protein [Planctomycetota bacterium]